MRRTFDPINLMFPLHSIPDPFVGSGAPARRSIGSRLGNIVNFIGIGLFISDCDDERLRWQRCSIPQSGS